MLAVFWRIVLMRDVEIDPVNRFAIMPRRVKFISPVTV